MPEPTLHPVRLFTVRFAEPIEPAELVYFRGAIIEKVGGRQSNDWFHNHDNNPQTGKQHHFRYPLIQYQLYRQCPQLVFVNEAIGAAQHFFVQPDWTIHLHQRPYESNLADLRARQTEIGHLGASFREYRLYRWLPLNTANYERYLELNSLVERIRLLESVLVGQIFALATGLGIRFQERLEVVLLDLQRSQVVFVPYKGVHLLQLSVRFRANVALPTGIGLGKGVALGHGRIQRCVPVSEPTEATVHG